MWYWFRPRFRGSPGMSRAQFRYGVKLFILPLALICIALKLVLVFVYHQTMFGVGMSIRLTPFEIYLLLAPVVWFVIFRWWMRRQNRGNHHKREPGQAWYSDRR